MLRGRARLTLALAVLLTLLLAAIIAGGAAALVLSPAVLAVLPFLVRRYPGEALLARLARRERRPRRAPGVRLPRAPRSLGRRPALLASRGASRAPPAFSLT